MPGLVHIIRLSEARDRYDRRVTDYQLTYDVESGNSFSRTFSVDEPLDEFLRNSAVVPEGEVERAFDELGKHGRTTIPNVDIPLKETGPLGLTQEPSDY